MAEYLVQDTSLTAIADAIRAKTGAADTLSLDGMAKAIGDIPTGVELPELTAEGAASDLRSGKQLIDGDGNIITGTAAAIQGNASYTVPPVYVTAAAGAVKLIEMSKTFTEPAFIGATGDTEIRLRSETSNFGDATAEDVVAGKTFTSAAGLKVTGTYTPLDTSDADAAASDILAGKTAYVNGEKVTGTHECAEVGGGGSGGSAYARMYCPIRFYLLDIADDQKYEATEADISLQQSRNCVNITLTNGKLYCGLDAGELIEGADYSVITETDDTLYIQFEMSTIFGMDDYTDITIFYASPSL